MKPPSLLTNETEIDFNALRAELEEEIAPKGVIERIMVDGHCGRYLRHLPSAPLQSGNYPQCAYRRIGTPSQPAVRSQQDATPAPDQT
jgi:hypothetical protein